MLRVVRLGVMALAVLFVAIQLVPYGRDHANPPVVQQAPWPTEEARRLARRACYDCHSNETRWPWYSHVAPMSWLVQDDVDEGREAVNFSEWNRRDERDDLVRSVLDGSMPPTSYRLLHPSAQLTLLEKQELVEALAVLADDEPDRRRGRGRG